MASHTILREDWTSFFDRFSLSHLGTLATLEARDPQLGNQVVALDQTFFGISADQKDGENRIAIMMGAASDDSTSHAVMAPERVVHHEAIGGSGESLEIGCAKQSSTLLQLRSQALS